MKFLNDQRRMYLLSACLLALTIVLCCTWSLWGDREPVSDSPAGAEGDAEGGEADLFQAFQTGDGAVEISLL